jgi:hypothetical protein
MKNKFTKTKLVVPDFEFVYKQSTYFLLYKQMIRREALIQLMT